MLSFPKNRILSPKPVKTYKLGDYITAIAWSGHDPANLATATANGEIQLGFNSPQILQTATNESIDCLSFSANSGNYLAATGENGKVIVWELTNNQSQPRINLNQGNTWIDFLAWQNATEFAFSLGKYIQIWSAETKDIVNTLSFENSTVQALMWQGNLLAVGGYQAVKIWNALDWDCDPYILELPTAVKAIAWNSDGTCLVIATIDDVILFLDYQLDCKDCQAGFQPSPFQLRGFPSKIQAITWGDRRGDRKYSQTLAIASGNEISIWQPCADPNQGWEAEILNIHSSKINVLEFQPHTNVLASGGKDGKVRLSQGANELQTLNANGEITCLKWHGSHLAIGTDNGEVLVWSGLQVAKGKRGFGS
jgi:WD40 repeat protein